MTDKLIMTTELAERLKNHLAGAIDEVDEADELYQLLQSLPMVSTEPVAWESPAGSGFIRYVTDEKYKKFTSGVQSNYKPFKCSKCSIQTLTPITADDVTDEMLDALNANTHPASTRAEILAAAYNAFIKHKVTK